MLKKPQQTSPHYTNQEFLMRFDIVFSNLLYLYKESFEKEHWEIMHPIPMNSQI